MTRAETSTASDPLQTVLARLKGVKPAGPGKYQALCPAHGDRKPSLSIARGDDGRVLLHCHAGCTVDGVLQEIGLSSSDLFSAKARGRKPAGRIVATYDYRDESGNLLSQVVRFKPKDFRQRRPDGNGGWVSNLKSVRRVLYRLPELLAADPAERVFVAEGEKDVETLRSLQLTATTNPMGAGNWTQVDDSPLRGRRVVILPDADGPGRKHARQVAHALHGKAALVKIVELPGAAKDVSDFVESHDAQTPEELRECLTALADAAPTYDEVPKEPTADRADHSPSPSPAPGLTKQLADAITERGHFARDAGGRLFVFSGGVYRPRGAQAIKERVKRLLEEWGLSKKWTSHRAAEVVEYVRVDAAQLWERPPLGTLNVRNGLLDVASRTLRPHDPKYLSPIQLPVSYDPSADCPEWQRFTAEVLPPDASHVPFEVAAWLMLPDTWLQKAILLLGEGANGKSVLLAALTALIGRENVANLSLHRLEADRFAISHLVGRLANVCPDLPSGHLCGTSAFKSLTGGDRLVGERKFRDAFEFTPYARLIFSANHPPRSNDASHAFFRRWLCVPFPRTFVPDEQVPRHVLDARLADPRELSGVLNRALDVLPGIRESGFTEAPSMRAALVEFRKMTDPVSVWLDAAAVEGSGLIAAKAQLVAAYNRDAQREGRPTLSAKAFSQALMRLRPQLEEGQRTIGGGRKRVWLGIGLRSDR